MPEISFEYWNKLATQTIVINSLLGGFSIAIIANLIVSEIDTRISRSLMVASTLAASSFLVSLFAMTNLVMMTTKGYPFPLTNDDLLLPRILGVLTLVSGVLSLVVVISLAGWTKSKKMGRFTTTLGIITFILFLLMST